MPRRRILTPDKLERVIGALRAGASDEVAGQAVGVTGQAIRNWAKRHPEFAREARAAKEFADGAVTVSLYKMATGQVTGKRLVFNKRTGDVIRDERGAPVYEETRLQPNVTACIFWLKNRQPDAWKDRVDHAGDPDRPVKVVLVEEGAPEGAGGSEDAASG